VDRFSRPQNFQGFGTSLARDDPVIEAQQVVDRAQDIAFIIHDKQGWLIAVDGRVHALLLIGNCSGMRIVPVDELP
jgi:hypothetical protein